MNTSKTTNNIPQKIRCAIPSWLLPVLPTLLLLLMPTVAKSAQYGDFYYEQSGGTITIYGYTGSGGAVTIPSTIDGLPVASIGDFAFGGCASLTNVTIPNSVTNIGNCAFWGCSSLTSVTMGNSVATIGVSAFDSCTNLTGVYFQGNAPSVGWWDVFYDDHNATVYYLPGTTGWSSSFAGRPAVLWNPQVQTTGASFGVRTNRFGFSITGASNLVIVVEACTDLANPTWSPLQTNTLSGDSVYFSDAQWRNYPARFYRLHWP